MRPTPPDQSGGLRAMIAEALRAYELAQAARLHAETEAADTHRERVAGAEAARDAELGRLESQRRQVLMVAQAEQERGGALLANIEEVDQAARSLLEKAGLAHITGAPLQVEETAA